MFKAILITILIAAPLAALATSFAEYKLNYNLWDFLKDKFNALRGRAVYESQLTIRVTRADLHLVETAILGLPNRINAAVRRRL
jgi:hypothetical protein